MFVRFLLVLTVSMTFVKWAASGDISMGHAALGIVVLGLIILLVPSVKGIFKLAMAITAFLVTLIALGHGNFQEMISVLGGVLLIGLSLLGLAWIVGAPFGKRRKKE